MSPELHEVLNETVRVMEQIAKGLREHEWNMTAAVLEDQCRQLRSAITKELP